MEILSCEKQWCGSAPTKTSTSKSLNVCVTLHGKGELRQQMGLSCHSADFKIGRLLSGPNVITIPLNVKEEGRRGGRRDGSMRKTWSNMLTLKMEEDRHKPRNVDTFQKLDRAREWILPTASRKECISVNTFIWAPVRPILDF